MAERPHLNPDFVDLLSTLTDMGVEFLVVGAHALAAHGVVRSTGDLDILVRPSIENARRVCAALRSFGAPVGTHGVSEQDFAHVNTVYQLGLPPRRIDLLTSISGIDFDGAWAGNSMVETEGVVFRVPSRDALLINKRASGRPKDLEDVRRLEATSPLIDEPSSS